MMFNNLPDNIQAVAGWSWADFAPYYADLEGRALSAEIHQRLVSRLDTGE